MKKRIQYILFGIVLALVGSTAAWFSLPYGFGIIQEIRQIERVPVGNAAALLPGEVILVGQAESAGKIVISTKTKTPSLYFHYLHEVEKRDSDGDAYWDVEDSVSQGVDFRLRDKSGVVDIQSGQFTHHIKWFVAESYQSESGRNRYTEWRLEPGNSLFIFGLAKGSNNSNRYITFSGVGDFTPIVSNMGQAEAQSSIGANGVVMIWLGLVGIALLVLGGMLMLGVHRILVYLSVLSVCITIALVQLSLVMMESDLNNAMQRYQSQLGAVEIALREIFEPYGKQVSPFQDISEIDFLDPQDAKKIALYRQFMGENYRHLASQMQAFPEKLLLPRWGMQVPESPQWITPAEWGVIDANIAARPPVQVQAPWLIYTIVGGLLAFLATTYMGYDQIRHKRLIENVPTTETLGVSCGLTEISGVAVPVEGAEVLYSPLENRPCFWYHYVKEEKRGSGKRKSWHKVEDVTNYCRLICRDEHGEILVDPKRSEIMTKHSKSKREGNFRYSEKTLRHNDELYTIGVASVDKHKSDRLIVGRGSTSDPFIVSNYPEKIVMLSKANSGMSFFTFATGALLLAVLMLFARSGGFAPTDFLLAALVAPIYLIAVMIMLHYNDLLFMRNRADRNYANIEVALKKRYDLLRNLEQVAKTLLSHEKELLTRVTQMRSRIKSAKQGQQQLEQFLESERAVLDQLNVVVEQYPNLKTNAIMKRLTSTMVRLENELALMRKGYNDAVEAYNTRILSVPDVFIAKLAKFTKKDFLSN